MKVKVLKVFQDKFNGELYAVDQILDWDDQDRIDDCRDRELIEVVEEAPKKAKTKTKAKQA